MSDVSRRGQIAPPDASNYAPRNYGLRRLHEQRSTLAGEPQAEREAGPEPGRRTAGQAPSLDWQLENAVFESLRRPDSLQHLLDPEVMPEPPVFASGVQRRSMAGFASRLALAVGVSAVAALVIVIMLARQPNAISSFASTLENTTAAATSRTRQPEEEGSKLAEFKGLLTTPGEANESAPPAQPDHLLQQFLVWRDNTNLHNPPQ
jgi:hypothetical protein